MTELPKGWAIACLDELAESVRNGVFVSRPAEAPPGEPILRISSVRPMRLDSSDIRFARKLPANAEAARLAVGDLLFTRYSGTRDFVGACAVVGEDSVGVLHPDKLIRVVPNDDLVGPHYLEAFCSSPPGRAWLDGAMKTTAGQTGLAGSDLKRLPVALAPRNEQERIVAAIEEAFSKLDAGEAGLRTVRQLLKRMRDAILTAAVTGRLVPQDPTDTAATKLLADLGVQPIDDAELPKLPPGWAWTTIEATAADGRHALAIGPFGSSLKVSDYEDEGVPLVFVRNIRRKDFRSDLKYVNPVKAAELKAHRLEHGDVLVTKMGDPPGDTAIYSSPDPAIITADCIKITCGRAVIPAFMALAISTGTTRQMLLGETRGVAQKKISLGRFRGLPFPVPPLDEQQRIVAEVDRQFSFIEACERAVEVGLVRSAGLRRSVLKAAFEGRLVPQDPSDEPASALLERIRAERAPQSVAKRRARQTA